MIQESPWATVHRQFGSKVALAHAIERDASLPRGRLTAVSNRKLLRLIRRVGASNVREAERP